MAGLFQAASKQRNPLGTTIRTHGSGKYTFGLALSAGQYPRSACLFLSAPRGMRHLPDQCHQLHHRLLRFQKLGCQRRLALDAEAGCDSGRRVPALHGASTGKPTIPHSSRQNRRGIRGARAHHRHFDQGVNAALRYCIAMLPCCRVIASLRCHVAALLHRYVATLPHHIALPHCCVAASHIATQTQQRNDDRRWHRRHPRGTAVQRGNVTQCDVIPA